jgi:hypothetical protein
MQTTSSDEHPKLALPFLGRRKEVARLERLHAQCGHALILGPAGVGKTYLVNHLRGRLGLLVCPRSEHLVAICESLEAGLGLDAGGLRLPQRKQRLLRALAGAKRTVVFDGVNWTTPKLCSFLEGVMERAPVWICARSEHSWDIGHFWTWLVRFDKVELHSFHPAETHVLVSAAVEVGLIPREALNIAEWLHHRSDGNPLVLRELFEELAARRYDLSNPFALRRLNLDRRIHEVFPLESTRYE